MYKNTVDILFCQNRCHYSFLLNIFDNWLRWNRISGKVNLPLIETSCLYNASSVVSNVMYLVYDSSDIFHAQNVFWINLNMLNATFAPVRSNA